VVNPPRRELDVVVVGAGVIGLASAAALARRGQSTVVVERHPLPAQETSSHNSQVIHAGLYDPPDSLKTRLCVAGRELLYERCRQLRIPHRAVGKLIVATTPGEVSRLEEIWRRGRENGVPDLELIDGQAIAEREPAVAGCAALLSPRSGIVDAPALCRSFEAELEAAGGQVLYRTELLDLEPGGAGLRITVRDADGSLERVRCAALVNAAGLESDRLAQRAGLDVDRLGYRLHLCKGDYFALRPGVPLVVRGLVYPLRERAGLGIHVTPDLGGRLRLGPDTEWVERPSYRVDPGKAEAFARSARRYLPELRSEWLEPDSAGVRPKLAGPGEDFRDFLIREESDRGLPGLVDLIGIESPGLTAAPAIAERVAALLRP